MTQLFVLHPCCLQRDGACCLQKPLLLLIGACGALICNSVCQYMLRLKTHLAACTCCPSQAHPLHVAAAPCKCTLQLHPEPIADAPILQRSCRPCPLQRRLLLLTPLLQLLQLLNDTASVALCTIPFESSQHIVLPAIAHAINCASDAHQTGHSPLNSKHVLLLRTLLKQLCRTHQSSSNIRHCGC